MTERNEMTTIHPKFPTQDSIAAAVKNLSPEDKSKYEALLSEYRELVSKEEVTLSDHERIAELMAAATKILSDY